MPARTGASHALSAVIILLLSPFLQEFVKVLVAERDLVPALEAFAKAISNHPNVPFSTDITTTLVFFVTVGVLAFIWGVAYHLNRHGVRE